MKISLIQLAGLQLITLGVLGCWAATYDYLEVDQTTAAQFSAGCHGAALFLGFTWIFRSYTDETLS